MSSTGWQSATGSGDQAFSGGSAVNITYIFLHLTGFSNPRVRLINPTYPGHIQYGGICGLMNQDPDETSTNRKEVVLEHHLNWESEIWAIPGFSFGTGSFQYFFWRLQTGQTLHWNANW